MRLFIIILFMFSFLVKGQKLDFRYYGVKEGLTQISVKCLYEDSRGLLWVGTSGGGLLNFNGRKFTNMSDDYEFDQNIIIDIDEDSSGDMVILGATGEAYMFNGLVFSPIVFKDSINDKRLSCITSWNDMILLGGKPGLLKLDGGKAKRIALDLELKEEIKHFYVNPIDSHLFIISHASIHEIDQNFKLIKVFPIDIKVNAVTTDDGNNLILGTPKGLYTVDSSGTIESLGFDMNINAFLRNKKGDIWMAHDKVMQISGEGHWLLDKKKGLETRAISSILEDKQGNLWIGTLDNGLVQWKRNGFTYFFEDDNFGRNDIFNFSFWQDKLWATSLNHGLCSYDPKTNSSQNYDLNDPYVKTYCSAIREDQLITGTNNGLYQLKNKKLQNISEKYGLTKDHIIRRLFVDSENRLWVGTAGQGLFIYDKQKQIAPQSFEVFKSLYVHDIIEDKNHAIWIGTGVGTYKYEDGKLTHFNNFCNSYSGSLLEDHLGRIWIGSDRCISILDGEKVTTITTKHGLNSNTIFSLAKDKQNNIYAGTNAGLNKISVSETGEILSITRFGEYEGFKGTECNARSAITINDKIYFGTIAGVIGLNLKSRINTPSLPKLVINNVSLFLRKQDWVKKGYNVDWFGIPQTLNLGHEENHVSFAFDMIDLGANNIEYQYKLEGFDEDFSPLSPINQAVYSNLPPGDYTFVVKAQLSTGAWSETLSYGPIHIAELPPPPPPVYKQWWFYLLLGIPIVMLLYYYTVIRNRELSISKKQLEAEVELRTAEIQRQNDEKEVMIKEIHHRVKNNLQIINSLLNLQAHYVTDKKSLQAFEECKTRITSMALIHERMYESNDLAHIKFGKYVEELAQNLNRIYSIERSVGLSLEINPDVEFKIDLLVPLGIVLNELISNSLKYAFTEQTSPVIQIVLSDSDHPKYKLTVSDNGQGFPQDFDWKNTESLGLQLVQILCEQIGATVELNQSKGTSFEVNFRKT